MTKKLAATVLALAMLLALTVPAMAARDEHLSAANELNALGLFQGVGTLEDGSPDYALDESPNRVQGVTMLVRLLGKESEALAGEWTIPFTDVPDWGKPYVGYAYTNGVTNGISETEFGSENPINAAMYITFVLRALGYDSSTDFRWDAAWELSDTLGITDGRYTAEVTHFTRGDMALISRSGLYAKFKGQERTLMERVVEQLNESQLLSRIICFTSSGEVNYTIDFAYDEQGRRIGEHDSSSNQDVNYSYNEWGYLAERLTQTSNENEPDNVYQTRNLYTYDDQGNRIGDEFMDSLGNSRVTTYTYADGHIVRSDTASSNVDPSFAIYAYHPNGNLASITTTDESGYVTVETYNEQGLIISRNQQIMEGIYDSTTYEYDAAGRLIKETQRDQNGLGSTGVYTYNVRGDLYSYSLTSNWDTNVYVYYFRYVYINK